jgi:hypothetical protein
MGIDGIEGVYLGIGIGKWLLLLGYRDFNENVLDRSEGYSCKQ